MNDFEYILSNTIRKDLAKYIVNSILPVPEKLFRYTGLKEYVLSDLTNNQLKPVDPSYFNDTYDSSLIIDNVNGRPDDYTFIRRIYENANDMGNYRKIVEKRKKLDFAIKDHFKNHFRIMCFSEICNDIKMWDLYADYNKGICIEALSKVMR